jgi:hypothetical protein
VGPACWHKSNVSPTCREFRQASGEERAEYVSRIAAAAAEMKSILDDERTERLGGAG